MNNRKSIIELIKERKSTRTYLDKPIDGPTKEALNKDFLKLKGPFNIKTRLMLIDIENTNDLKGAKLGTYGVIKGAPSYLLGAVESGDCDLEEIGFVFEEAILHATSLGLGTCWLGGTFRRGEFAKAIGLGEDETLPVITPLGYAKNSQSLVDKFFRYSAGSDGRKDWSELFFDQSFSQALAKEQAGKYVVPLEMVRLAPSASNKQPWRIVKEGKNFHFYRQMTPKYSDRLGFDIQRIDLGIAMCHFQLTLEELGVGGQWSIEEPVIGVIPDNTFYTATWKL